MISQNFIYLSLFFVVIGNGGYIINTWKGKTQPNRVTWFLWSFAALVTLLSQHKLGGGIVLLYTAMQIVLSFSVFLVSFKNKKAYWKLTKYDFMFGTVSFTGIVILIFTKQPMAALILGIMSDFFASIPTIIKCYTHPQTEYWKTYFFGICSSLIAVLTVEKWVFIEYSFAFYVMLINMVFVGLILMPRQPKKAIA